jgi:hypothetical protein
LNDFGIVETHALPIAEHVNPMLRPTCCQQVFEIPATVGVLPVRFTAAYDIAEQATRVVVDLLARHVGNYYRTIINGPLHRHKMPFQHQPEDNDLLLYTYMPPKNLDYKYDCDTGEIGYDDEPIIERRYLENLDLRAVSPRIEQRYEIKGQYCYYKGERLIYEVCTK